MKNKSLLLLIALFQFACSSKEKTPQIKWEPVANVAMAHLRGLHVVDENVVWASGAKGTVLHTLDGGASWKVDTSLRWTGLDFRDCHALGGSRAWVLSAGHPAKIYYTENGGRHWAEQYSDSSKGVFYDGISFWDESNGLAYGDPVGSRLAMIRTQDGGKHWKKIDTLGVPTVLKGEAGFAASGTGIVTMGKQKAWIATGGGERARVFRTLDGGNNWEVADTPLLSGEGMGIFSMAFLDEQRGVVVGGAYLDSTSAKGNCAVTNDGGKTWKAIEKNNPRGYRSCVAYHPGADLLVAVGRTGAEISLDGGHVWMPAGEEGYYTCGFSMKDGWAVGRSGKMAKIHIEF